MSSVHGLSLVCVMRVRPHVTVGSAFTSAGDGGGTTRVTTDV